MPMAALWRGHYPAVADNRGSVMQRSAVIENIAYELTRDYRIYGRSALYDIA